MEFSITSSAGQEVIDITDQVEKYVRESECKDGVCQVFVPHATAAITVNENDDPNIGKDFLKALDRAIPQRAGYLHDQIDGNAHAHIKASLIGPSQTIPIRNGNLLLGTWQDIFLCEFDGPKERKIVVQVLQKN